VTDQVGFYRENGYVLVPGVFDDSEVRAMRDGLDRILDAVSGPLEAEGESHTVDYALASGVACPASAGDVLFFNYLTVHGSGVNRSARTRRNVLFQYRDPADAPVLREGVEEHVDWGMGLMVAGGNPGFWGWRPRFRIRQAEFA